VIGIVDLMASTARGMAAAQFTRLLATALSEAPRVVNLDPTETSGSKADWDAIASFDAVIVTGAEPSATDISEDLSYAVVGRILESATGPVLLSCLSAHVALAHLYSLPRTRFSSKRSGVFTHTWAEGRITGTVELPHSRWHTVQLNQAVNPLLVADDGDWALASSEDYLFLQAHPEYFGDTLLREYRRDVRRFLDRSSHTYPTVPTNYLPAETVAALQHFSFRARRRRSPETFRAFPDVSVDPVARWSVPGAALVAGWLRQTFGVVNV
jgi:homoserine O-succinyltransferase/O-acetyltransferase